jgi:hypothetical protein
MSRPLTTFSILSLVYDYEKQTQQTEQIEQTEQTLKQKKIIIIKKVPQVQQSMEQEEEKQTTKGGEKKKILIVRRKCKRFADIAPPATMCRASSPMCDFYYTPPPNCCRFFIENKDCFLRQRDNACICPVSRTVIGFWNEKVGQECKLLPIEDETAVELVTSPDPISPTKSTIVTPTKSTIVTPTKSQKQKNNSILISNPKIVSDAQRARIACEPVALLREKLAKQYGIVVKKN